jgi:hypothetical protein
LARAVAVTRDGASPGLERMRWRIGYRGGIVREVGAAQLVGPFQDPARPPCGGRIVVGQRFLDDGAAGPGTVAAQVRAAVEAELRGFEQFPAGRFERVGAVEVRWVRLGDVPGDAAVFPRGAMIAAASHTDGYVRARVVIELERVTATATLLLVPRIGGDRIALDIHAHAHLSVGNRLLDWALDKFRADAYATRALQREVDDAILAVLDPPPPLELPGDRRLTVDYCPGARIAVHTDGWAAVPLALRFGGPAGSALPPRRGPVAPPPPAPATQLAFDLDLDTVNALLFELWRTGFLDDQLDAAGLDARFNDDPTVGAMLTLRTSPLRLALPPVVTPGPRGLRMAADLRVDLADRAAVTPARVWASVDVELGDTPTSGLAELELACEPEPGLLRPCYADLVAAMRAQAGDARDELSALLARILDDLFTGRRVAADGQPAEVVLGAPRTTATASGASATVRIDVPAWLE